MGRVINHIVLHCTATPQNTTPESILNYWKTVNKWMLPGYHHLIKADGTIVDLLPIEQVSNGVKGHNAHSIHISYIGGIDAKGNALDTRTPAQKASQLKLINRYRAIYPHAVILGHRDFLVKGKPGWKECPAYDVKSDLLKYGIIADPTAKN